MCLTSTCVVVDAGPDRVRVLAAGREHELANLLVPDVVVGDRVVVGLGMVLARAPAEADDADPVPVPDPTTARSQGGI